MYDYASLGRVNGHIRGFEPSDNLSINGIPLNVLVDGYRHLTVTGRGLLSRTVTTRAIPGRRGVWVDELADKEREIIIKYRLEAPSSSEMRDRFARLNRVLRNHAPSGFLELTFKDEPDFVYYAYFSEADEIEETALSVISQFTLLVPDGYKKKRAQESTGLISLSEASAVLPEEIVISPTGLVNQVQIINGDKVLSFSGAYAAGTDIRVAWSSDEIEATYGNRSILSELERYSLLEDFMVKNGDVITARNARVKKVVWRDERL